MLATQLAGIRVVGWEDADTAGKPSTRNTIGDRASHRYPSVFIYGAWGQFHDREGEVEIAKRISLDFWTFEMVLDNPVAAKLALHLIDCYENAACASRT